MFSFSGLEERVVGTSARTENDVFTRVVRSGVSDSRHRHRGGVGTFSLSPWSFSIREWVECFNPRSNLWSVRVRPPAEGDGSNRGTNKVFQNLYTFSSTSAGCSEGRGRG